MAGQRAIRQKLLACLRKLRRPAAVALATVASSSVSVTPVCFCFRYSARSLGFISSAADTGCSAARPCMCMKLLLICCAMHGGQAGDLESEVFHFIGYLPAQIQ